MLLPKWFVGRVVAFGLQGRDYSAAIDLHQTRSRLRPELQTVEAGRSYYEATKIALEKRERVQDCHETEEMVLRRRSLWYMR